MPQARYEILRPINSGGMAELYLARARGDDGHVRLVVLKRILPHLARDTAFVEMFLNEARIAATLAHPNVVAVTDFGQLDGDYFITMEYVHGADLGELLELAGEAGLRLPLDVALTIVQHACAGLHHAHELRGFDGQLLELVHRDVSPSNVMIGHDGSIKVTDFGIATAAALTRTTRAGTLKGKVSYMSPEQCKGDRIDRRADVFALGILLYETTLMTRLFVGDNDYALMNQVIEGRVPRPSEVELGYPAVLEGIVMRALAVDPKDRYPTANHLQRSIESWAASQGMQLSSHLVGAFAAPLLGARPHPATELAAASTTAGTRVARMRHGRSWAWFGIAGAVGLLAAAVGGVTLAQPDDPQTHAPAPAPAAPTPVVAPPQPTASMAGTTVTRPVEAIVPVSPTTPPQVRIEEQPSADTQSELEEEELIVVEDEAAAAAQGRTQKRRRNTGKTGRTYDLDEAAPPR